MEKRDIQESLIWDTLLRVVLVIIGMVAGIALCKFWPGFWWFVNWGVRV